MKILIVEDEPMARRIAKLNTLKKADCVDTAEDGDEAYQLATTTNYDAIFMDIGLPNGFDGAQVTQKIRAWETESHHKHTPILALTAHATTEDVEYCLNHGVDKVFFKPLSLKQLDEMIQTASEITAKYN